MSFANTWNAIQSNLKAGISIANWTAAKGLLGDFFSVVAVTPTHIVVDTPAAQNLQKIPTADFQVVYNFWHRYRQGTISRAEIRDATRFSKYITSIFHWLEGRLGDQLP